MCMLVSIMGGAGLEQGRVLLFCGFGVVDAASRAAFGAGGM